MTKLLKRIISFSLAMAICVSFSSTAFAVEPVAAAVETSKQTVSVNSINGSSLPANDVAISGYLYGVSRRAPVNFSFTVPEGGAYLYFYYASNALPELTVFKNGVKEATLIPGIQTNGEVVHMMILGKTYTNGYWSAGTYTAQVVFGKLNESYSMCIAAHSYSIQ